MIPRSVSYTFIVAILLLLNALPFSVAVQNIVSSIFLVASIFCIARSQRKSFSYSRLEKITWCGLFVWIFLRALVGWCEGNYGAGKFSTIILGYLAILVVPILTRLIAERLASREPILKIFVRYAAAISFAWLLMAISQRIWGWAFYDNRLHWETFRAQAFYSHPLTFAYVLALLLPLTLRYALAFPERILNWFVFGSVLCSVILNESRTVQVTSVAICLLMALTRSTRTLTLRIFAGLLLVAAVLAVVPNQISKKFTATWRDAAVRTDRVADDRVVFWQAHWELIKEKPLFGWGAEIQEESLKRAYETIGRGEFVKKYNAHNIYLQTLAESGVSGFIALIVWIVGTIGICWVTRSENDLMSGNIMADGAFFGFLNFFIASLTQNSFYDSEVRYGFMLLATCLLLLRPSISASKKSIQP